MTSEEIKEMQDRANVKFDNVTPMCIIMISPSPVVDFARKAEKDRCALLAEVKRLQKELDAAVMDMKLLANEYGFCDMCKYFNSQQACEEPHPGLLCAENKKWEWRGLKGE